MGVAYWGCAVPYSLFIDVQRTAIWERGERVVTCVPMWMFTYSSGGEGECVWVCVNAYLCVCEKMSAWSVQAQGHIIFLFFLFRCDGLNRQERRRLIWMTSTALLFCFEKSLKSIYFCKSCKAMYMLYSSKQLTYTVKFTVWSFSYTILDL